ncbi:asparagine synthase (glutamine-hydrolyzing) [Dactylosporangium sp. NPDC048998]|uniref:asparagine synthase (glutamine-hydrolyzing) n=1 Tax=Dactylosporangium sp. NPDC048998 TaxID=3363976 RepID=UPI00371536B4
MCGLVGAFALDLSSRENGDLVGHGGDLVRQMARALRHRGPDGDGFHHDGAVSLGFRRLAINDPQHGHQPWRTDDGAVTVVCNGEIFNHRQLRAELVRRGHRFRTGCDTEVLGPLYQEYGLAITDRLDGQFVFAVHDAGRGRLVLARDPAGIVPLFYTVVDRCLLFASEIKALLHHPRVPRQVDLAGLDQALTLPGLVSPRTMFAGIRALRPGERLIADNTGIRLERYRDLEFPPADSLAPVTDVDRELDRWAEQVAPALSAAVEARAHADVAVGTYLSGGLDSSLIAALLGTARPGHRWPSYAVTFPGSDFDERGFQRLVAQKLGTAHREVPVSEPDVAACFRRMVRHCESPVRESYNVCSLLLSAAVRESGVRAVLTGEGADELFGGYRSYQLAAAGVGGNRLGGLDAHLEREIRQRMWGVDIGYEQDQLPAAEFRRELYAEDLAEGFDDFAVTGQQLVDPAALAGRHPLHQRSYLDFHLRLADHLLGDHGDRMALANGVELRLPFLAPAVIDLATAMPPELLVAHGREKAVLRRVAAGLVPDEVVHRPKFGFRGPTSSDLLAAGVDWFAELLSPSLVRRQGYFNPATVDALVRRQREGGPAVHPHLDVDYLMLVATFAVFLEEFDLPCLG